MTEPEAPEEPPAVMEADCPFDWFVRNLEESSLPGDQHGAGVFDNRADFAFGDPGAHFGGTNKCEYATSGEVGEPHWTKLFQYLLTHFAHVRWLSTVFVLVDNRDLTAPTTQQESLAHWPTVEAWWTSRLAMRGPAQELCDLLFVPIDQSAGLEHVHPTCAGTFVLAALTVLFPGVHVVLLEEVSSGASEESAPKASYKLSRDRWRHQVIGQGVLLVTEHNAEINAGFIVAFASCHTAPVQEDRWRTISDGCLAPQAPLVLKQEAERLEHLYWDYVGDFLETRRPVDEMDAKECATWVQSGLALAPFAGCVTKYTCDWAIAWSLIGEWTCREICLPPTGSWPCNGHSQRLLDDYAWRSPPILTWARACFEQGSLPSMLHLSGDALLCVLPGDRMFQAQRLIPGRARPVILHGYGGAKRDILRALPAIATEGWVPFAQAMTGFQQQAPARCGEDLRPVVGTSIDFRLLPDPLTEREQLLLLSLWRRVTLPCLPNNCALRTWLSQKRDVHASHGPDHNASPHSVDRDVDYETLFQGADMQLATTSPNLEPSREQVLAIRMVASPVSILELS